MDVSLQVEYQLDMKMFYAIINVVYLAVGYYHHIAGKQLIALGIAYNV